MDDVRGQGGVWDAGSFLPCRPMVCQDFVGNPSIPGRQWADFADFSLNAYLIKYAGIVVPIGETEESREEYMGLVIKTNDETLEEEARGSLGTACSRKSK